MSSSDAHASHEANVVPHQSHLDHYLAAVLDDEHGADAAARALQDASFARRDISVYHGAEGAKAIAAQERSERPLAKLLRALMDIEEGVVRQAYLDVLGYGASVVILHLPDPRQQQQAEDILRAHHAYELVATGPFTWEELLPS